MKISIPVTIKPFLLPTSVVVDSPVGKKCDGIKPLQLIALVNLDRSTVEKLCDDFKEKIMKDYDNSMKNQLNSFYGG
jgi:hypothetical protein